MDQDGCGARLLLIPTIGQGRFALWAFGLLARAFADRVHSVHAAAIVPVVALVAPRLVAPRCI
eukprot:12350935-Alexandrium_andersonii.AAC.1